MRVSDRPDLHASGNSDGLADGSFGAFPLATHISYTSLPNTVKERDISEGNLTAKFGNISDWYLSVASFSVVIYLAPAQNNVGAR